MKILQSVADPLASLTTSGSRACLQQVMTIACAALMASCGGDGKTSPVTSQLKAASIATQGPWAARHSMA